MGDFIINFVQDYGYIAVLLLIFIENVFPPIPSEVILTFAGFVTTYTSLNIPTMVLFATLGSLLGAYVLYGVGRVISEDRLRSFFNTKPLRMLGFLPDDVSQAVRWFNEKGSSTVFFCRFIPIVRSLISIPAGTSRMSVFKFSLYTFLGSAIWNTVLITLGRAFGAAYEEVVGYLDTFSNVVLIILIVLFLIGAIILYKKVLEPRIKERQNRYLDS